MSHFHRCLGRALRSGVSNSFSQLYSTAITLFVFFSFYNLSWTSWTQKLSLKYIRQINVSVSGFILDHYMDLHGPSSVLSQCAYSNLKQDSGFQDYWLWDIRPMVDTSFIINISSRDKSFLPMSSETEFYNCSFHLFRWYQRHTPKRSFCRVFEEISVFLEIVSRARIFLEKLGFTHTHAPCVPRKGGRVGGTPVGVFL